MTFCAVYAWAALAFQLCNRIEASLDDRALDGESDDDFSDDDDVEAGDFVADAAAGLKAAMSTVELTSGARSRGIKNTEHLHSVNRASPRGCLAPR